MASQDDSQQSVILGTPTPVSSPLQSQNITPSTHPRRDRPSIRLIPPPPFSSTVVANSFITSSSSASASTMPTPIDPTSAISLSSLSAHGWEDLSSSIIDSYDLTTLRSKLQLANQLIKTLSSSLSAMRTNAAHYLLQHKILEMETTEAAARHQVESEITRREVEVLRLDQSTFSITQQLALAEENEGYKRRLRRAKRSIREYREEIGDMKEENEKLKKRIRDNRQHQLDASRSPDDGRHGGGGHASSERHMVGRRSNGEADANEDGLAALRFLASQVLSQEMDESHHSDSRRATTPKPKHRKLPSSSTTTTTAPPTIRRTLMSPVAFIAASASRGLKRRRSRDSTISATDEENVASGGGGRRRSGHGANTLHSATRQRRCTQSPPPVPVPVIHEHKSSRRHHTQGADTPRHPGTPVSPPGRGKKGDGGKSGGKAVGLGGKVNGRIRSPP